MRPTVRTDAPQGYATALGDLWLGLGPTLAALERIAAVPQQLDEAADDLPALQHSLHTAVELAFGIEPPAGAEGAHATLALAIAEARDATAELADTLAVEGADAAAPLVWEWRGSLFGVRLARQTLAAHAAVEPDDAAGERISLLSLVLLLAGVAAVLGGALAQDWPFWVGGLAFVAASLVLSRGRP